MKLLLRAAAFLGLLIPAFSATIISTFDLDDEGWLVTDDGVTNVTHFAAGGNPGGYVQRIDATTGYMHFQAPAKFLGDLTAFAGGNITYDLRQTTPGSDSTWFYRVVVQGGGLMILYTEGLSPDTTNWITRTAPLDPAGWIVISAIDQFAGPSVTPAQFQSVLANVTGLFITGDLISELGDVSSLDSVVLQTPEPAAWMLVLAGAPILAVLRRYSRS